MSLPTAPYPDVYQPVTGQDLSPERTYSIPEMIATTGATPKQVDHWTRAGYLRPLERANATNGVRRRWPALEQAVCTRMALLVDVGLSVPLAHDVARHRGPYAHRGVQIRLGPEQPTQTATDAEREILRAPGRSAVAGALRALLDTAAAAAELLGLDAIGYESGLPLSDRYDVETLVQMGELVTGRDDRAPRWRETDEIPGPDSATDQ